MHMFRTIGVFINIVIGFIEFFLGFRFLFRLLGANPASPFVAWLYETTSPLLAPFQGMFPVPRLEAGGFVFEFTTIVALLMYMFIGYLLMEIVSAVDRSSK